MAKKFFKNNKLNRVYPTVFCIIVAIFTAICGATVKDFKDLFYLIGYTIMLFIMTEFNQYASAYYFESRIQQLEKEVDDLHKELHERDNAKES